MVPSGGNNPGLMLGFMLGPPKNSALDASYVAAELAISIEMLKSDIGIVFFCLFLIDNSHEGPLLNAESHNIYNVSKSITQYLQRIKITKIWPMGFWGFGVLGFWGLGFRV